MKYKDFYSETSYIGQAYILPYWRKSYQRTQGREHNLFPSHAITVPLPTSSTYVNSNHYHKHVTL